MLFSKTLVKQEISNPTESESKPKETAAADDGKEDEGNNEEQSISSKAQIMVSRVRTFLIRVSYLLTHCWSDLVHG